jgi:Predicted Zn-dependent protease (DUF2268)
LEITALMDRTWTLHWLQAAGTLAPWRSRIRAEIEAAFEACGKVLTPPRVDIVIHQIKHWPVSELGFGGSSPSRDTMFLGFDTAHPAMEAGLVGGLRRVIVHEAHHCLRRAGPGYGGTLGEVLVSEGLADHFTLEVLGGQPEPWSLALNAAELRKAAELAQTALRDPVDIDTWFHGADRQMLPWSGYSLGWHLTEAWLTRMAPTPPSRLVGVPAEDVIGSGWQALLNESTRRLSPA